MLTSTKGKAGDWAHPVLRCSWRAFDPINIGGVAPGKTTFEIPDTVFRRAESVAAHCGIPLIEFVTPFRVCAGVVGLDACA